MRAVLATRNAHKARELAALLAPHEIVALPADVTLPPETGETFAANALEKARAAMRATGLPAIADDSGIEAAALGGAPGVRSARFAGEDATDEENLARLVGEAPAGSALAYVCALVYSDPGGTEHLVEGRCTGTLGGPAARDGGLRLRPRVPARRRRRRAHHGPARPGREGRDQPPRPCRPRPAGTAGPAGDLMAGSLIAHAGGGEGTVKTRAAALSIASNTLLIALKLVAGVITGSVAIITEAMHSSIDLIASIVAYFSIREADKPADAEHPYGHAKIENLAAAIEGMLILVGSGVIIYESARRLAVGSEVHSLGIGIGVIAFSLVANICVSTVLARRARQTGSPALEGDAAHLRTDAATSGAVLVGLVGVELTGAAWLDPIVALVVAGAIIVAGVRLVTRSSRVLVDEALPESELDAIRETVVAFGPRGVCGFHKLRARRAGARRHVDMHVQFVKGMSLEDAHATAHALQAAIGERLERTDVLIHLEPQDRVVPGTEIGPNRTDDEESTT